MRFLADENLSGTSIRRLREAALDVEAVGEISPSAPDGWVLSHARENGQVLITFDRDFGELVYRRGAARPPGIVYLRIPATEPDSAARAVLDLLRIPDLVLDGWLPWWMRTRCASARCCPLNRRRGIPLKAVDADTGLCD